MTSWHSRNHQNSWFEQHINITQITYCCQKDLHLMGLLSRCMPRKWDAGWWSGQWAPTPVSICHSAMKFATSVIQLWIYYKPLQFFEIQDASHIFFFEWFSMIFAYFFLCGLTAIFKGQYAGKKIHHDFSGSWTPQKANARSRLWIWLNNRLLASTAAGDDATAGPHVETVKGWGQMAGNVSTAIAT